MKILLILATLSVSAWAEDFQSYCSNKVIEVINETSIPDHDLFTQDVCQSIVTFNMDVAEEDQTPTERLLSSISFYLKESFIDDSLSQDDYQNFVKSVLELVSIGES